VNKVNEKAANFMTTDKAAVKSHAINMESLGRTLVV